MPITQDRMITVINAARASLTAYKSIMEEIYGAVRRARAGEDAKALIEDLATMVNVLQPGMDVVEVIAIEESHFSAMQHHNELNKQRMALRRLDQRGFTQRHPRSESVRHRITDRKAELSAGLDAPPTPSFMTPEQFAKFEQDLAAEQRAAQAPKAEALPPNQNPELFRTHDAEAVEIEEVWKDDPSSIIGS